MSERDLVYLDSLVDAADAIREFIGSRTKEEFFAQRLVRDAVLRNLEVLGEQARAIRSKVEGRSWRFQSGVRHIVWISSRQLACPSGHTARSVRHRGLGGIFLITFRMPAQQLLSAG